MTTDFGRICPFSWNSPCLAPGKEACSWQRCVKRKFNDGSGQHVVEGFIMPRIEGNNRTLLREPLWGTMPQISHCQKGPFNVRKNKSSDVLQNEVDAALQTYLQAAKSSASLQKPCVAAESDTMYSLTNCPSANCVTHSQHFQGAGSGLPSKKRVHEAICEESVCASELLCDKNEILRLREALKSKRKVLRKLHKDLEEERYASAEAANEAMAMIRRLQEEKSAALVESRQYRLASEERETYNHEAIALLKEALLVMENEVRSLQERVEAYRNMVLKLRSREGNQLEGAEVAEEPLLLEGSKLSSHSLADSTEFLYNSQIEISDITKEQPWGGGLPNWHRHLCQMNPSLGHDFNDICFEGHKSEISNVSETQDLDDVSMSILARVTRLEERFACLGHDHAVDSDCFDQVSCDLTKNLAAEQLSCPETSGRSLKLREGYVCNEQQDLNDLQCSDFEKVAKNPDIQNQEQGFSVHVEEPLKSIAGGCTPKDGRGHEPMFEDAESEAIYDVFEVQCDPNSCALPLLNANCKSGHGSTDLMINSSVLASDKKLAEGQPAVSVQEMSAIDVQTVGNLSTEVSFINGEATKSSMASEDVYNLKVRLQALEGERAFMKVAIDSLRKENMELKLLQDIAQQLRELKGDVWSTGVKGHGHQEQSPFLSFIKGILSFVGMQSNMTTGRRRFFHPCQETSKLSCKDQGQPGLFHLLNTPTKEERLLRVMRECKVKLSSASMEKTR